jgi:hypothetical protein
MGLMIARMMQKLKMLILVRRKKCGDIYIKLVTLTEGFRQNGVNSLCVYVSVASV